MSRPALSASRSIDIIDFLGIVPGAAFTLSQIARAVNINAASCLSVLNVLTERGYLSRSSNKTYTLGPALVAMGHAAMRGHPLISRAENVAEELNRELRAPVYLTGLVGNEIIAISSFAEPTSRGIGIRVGTRLPLIPPTGAPFLAWSSEPTIERWIERRPDALDRKKVEAWRHNLAIVRKRGFQVLLRPRKAGHLVELLAEFAAGRKVADYKNKIIGSLETHEGVIQLPEQMSPKELYDVVLIAAPIFDQNGDVVYNLCIGDTMEKISGEMIQELADRLLRSCVQIMQHARTA